MVSYLDGSILYDGCRLLTVGGTAQLVLQRSHGRGWSWRACSTEMRTVALERSREVVCQLRDSQPGRHKERRMLK